MRDAGIIDRFLQGLKRAAAATPAAPSPFDAQTRIAIAVSGGTDSLALLLLANAQFAGRIAAATFDHGFRPESKAEAAHVAGICARLGVPHVTLDPARKLDAADIADLEQREAGGLQALARIWRYRRLAHWCANDGVAWLLTAHHADDQAETVLMRLARGAGPRGLSGIRPSLTAAQALGEDETAPEMTLRHVVIGRPLLRFAKNELASIVDAAALVPVVDPSNADPRFDRTRARDVLARTEWLDPRRIGGVADIMRDTEQALVWAVHQAWDRHVVQRDAIFVVDPRGLPDAILWRICEGVIRDCEIWATGVTLSGIRGRELSSLIERLRSGQPTTLCHVMAKPGERWLFRPAPRRRAATEASSRFATSIRVSIEPPRPSIGRRETPG